MLDFLSENTSVASEHNLKNCASAVKFYAGLDASVCAHVLAYSNHVHTFTPGLLIFSPFLPDIPWSIKVI